MFDQVQLQRLWIVHFVFHILPSALAFLINYSQKTFINRFENSGQGRSQDPQQHLRWRVAELSILDVWGDPGCSCGGIVH